MFEFVHITDLHLANKPPESRTDGYNDQIFKKLQYVFNYCVDKKLKYIALTGDLAHGHTISDELATRFAKLVSEYDIKILFVYGNHDIQGGNTNFIHKTNFGLLEIYPWFICVDKNPIVIEDCLIAGYDYDKEKAIQSTWLMPDIQTKLKYEKRILLTHPMIVNEATMIIDGKVKQVNVHEVETNADLMLCGHYHDGFVGAVRDIALNRDFCIVNPGSLARTAIDWNGRESKGPRFAHIKMGKKISVSFVKVPCLSHDKAFDVDKHRKQKEREEGKLNFIEAMEGLSQSQVMGENFAVQLEFTLHNPPEELKEVVSKRVMKICREKASKHL